jgi:ferrous iron transport protein B
MSLKVALVGNPNSGKTTLFNALTGSNQYVGNWPGVTVEKKSGKVRFDGFDMEIIDLPGIYSLSTISLEEEVTSHFVLDRQADVIINIVDASNLERNLYLTMQLLDGPTPVVIALNCMDIVEKQLANINTAKLEKRLGVPIVPITATKKLGTLELLRRVEATEIADRFFRPMYDSNVESTIAAFQTIIKDRVQAIRFFEDGSKALTKTPSFANSKDTLIQLAALEAKRYELDFDMVIPNARYALIETIRDEVLTKPHQVMETSTDRIDRILTHRVFGLPLFGLIMFAVFFLSFGPIGTWITDHFVALIEAFFGFIASLVETAGMAEWVTSLITNGFFGGLASVVGFLPQLAILFLFLSILEDTGYMARAAFIMDRALRRFGLSGKSFIPMLLGFGCSVPAMVSTRTLDKSDDRKITTMIIPFMSCGAKAPIYGVFAGALFANGSYLVVFSMYLIGILVALFSALLFKKTILKGASANYLMELPDYRVPTLRNTLLHTWDRVKGFLLKAGTILLGAFILIWFFSYFGFVDGTFRLLADNEIEFSILGRIGKFILPIFQPIGFNDWRATVAILTGFVAKESVVGTLGILYGAAGDAVENGHLLFPYIQAAFTPAQAFSYMTFALLSAPCIAAIAAMKKELVAWRWFFFTLAYEMVVAYGVSFIVYQLGSMPSGDLFTTFFFVLVVLIVFTTIRRVIKNKGNTCGTCSSCATDANCQLPQKKEHDSKQGGTPR